MITEKTIERVIAAFEKETFDFEKVMREFGGRQPALLSFLLSDTEGALSADEQDMQLYLAAIIWKSVEMQLGEVGKVPPESVAEAEEKNWALLESTPARSFRERLTPFFKDTPQEDLLAFVEDSLTSDEDGEEGFELTPEGREPMFIALKTVIDVLTEEDEE